MVREERVTLEITCLECIHIVMRNPSHKRLRIPRCSTWISCLGSSLFQVFFYLTLVINVERTGKLNLVVRANDKRATWVQTYHSLYIVFLQIGDWLSDCTQRWSRLISGPSENGKILEWPDWTISQFFRTSGFKFKQKLKILMSLKGVLISRLGTWRA